MYMQEVVAQSSKPVARDLCCMDGGKPRRSQRNTMGVRENWVSIEVEDFISSGTGARCNTHVHFLLRFLQTNFSRTKRRWTKVWEFQNSFLFWFFVFFYLPSRSWRNLTLLLHSYTGTATQRIQPIRPAKET